jgi:heterodisulfide reductase subunit B
MKYALFRGCTIPARLPQYEASSRAVLGKLGVELVDIREFNCCGYPLRNTDFKAAILCATRNLALAQREELEMLVLCKCGFGMLKYTASLMEENVPMREEINTLLKREGLNFKGPIGIKHLLTVLSHDVGVARIKEKVTRPYHDLRVATHYGCHALRPSEITHFDDPVNPTLFEALVALTGAESIEWQERLECCGAPLFGVNDELSMELTQRKLLSAQQAGAQYLCTACPYCHIQFDRVQGMIPGERGEDHLLPPILYPQLLGLSLGIDGETLGVGMNEIEITSIEGFLSE